MIHTIPFLILTTTLLLVSCNKKAELAEPPLRPVVTFTVQPATSETTRRFSGQVDSAEGTSIAFEVSGRVLEVSAKAGRKYEAETPLARIDDTDYRNQFSDAQAQFTNAEQELRRMQRLYVSKNVSQSQLEAAIAQEQSARANFKRAEKTVDDCILKMPYAGVIGLVDVEPQDVISAGQSMMTIQGDAGLEFEIGVPAEDIGNLNVDMVAAVTLGAFPNRSFPAKISEISPQVDKNTTYPVTLALSTEKTDRKIVRPGLDGEAILSLPNPLGSVLRVPSESVAAAPDGEKFVWIVEPTGDQTGKVERRPVESGDLAPDNMIEITTGVDVGDVIVTRGVHQLDSGMEVSLKN
ncbi:MAG: efflux RND transporter periplasmic adaptor subunit [Verrucomicrobiales bacterium]|nr:efflux RND transporter periplasmic adaptor subunit [Verrucomicrobiales bacterium]